MDQPAFIGEAVIDAPPVLAPGLVWRAVLCAPLLVVVAALLRGGDGAASAAVGVGLALWNLFMAARSLTWASQRSTAVLAGVALGGYVVRLIVLTVVVLAIKDLAWVDLPALGFTLVVTHLALVVWEAKAAGFLAPRAFAATTFAATTIPATSLPATSLPATSLPVTTSPTKE